jgi:hypothetical protein
MITVDKLDKNLNDMLAGWFTKFEPLYIAVYQEKLAMDARIFPKGKDGGTNTAGDVLPTEKYSTTAIYVSPNDLRNAPAKFKKGKRGKPIKSLYFPFGYAQLKTETSATKPLQLTGDLFRSFIRTPTGEDGLNCSIEISEEQTGKIKGLQSKYGKIFIPTKEEQDSMLLLHAELIIEQINKQFNG